jgi:hypothetical protein
MTRLKAALGIITAIILLVIVLTIQAYTLPQTGLRSGGEGQEQTPSILYPLSLAPPDTPMVLVSAKDSDPAVQERAAFHCTGRDDQQQIESAIKSLPNAGGTVVLAAGTYQCSADLHLGQRVRLMGMGEEQTQIHFSAPADLEVREQDEVRDLKITGSASLFITESHVNVQNVTMTVDQSKKAAFYIYANNRSIEDFSFQNCSALNCGTHGFMNNGEGRGRRVSFVRYLNCRSLNAGLTERYDPWITGFDLTESVDLYHCLVQNCTAEGSWESGFHIEESPQKVDVVLENCTSLQNGQKQSVAPPKFGAGFLLSGDTTAIDCISDGNHDGYLCFTGARLVRCSDRRSGAAYIIVDHKDVNLQDCRSVLAESRALILINASDVRVEGFKVTDPGRNTEPIIQLGSPSTSAENISITGSVNCAGTNRQVWILNGVGISLSGDLTTAAEQAVSIEGDATDGIHISDLLISSSSSSSDSAGVQISSDVSSADTIWIEQSVITAASPSQGLAYGVMNRAEKRVKVVGGLTSGVTVPYYNCDVREGMTLDPWFF